MTILRGSKQSTKMQVQNSKQENMHHVTSDVPKGHKLLTNVQIFVIIINFGIFRVDCKKNFEIRLCPHPSKKRNKIERK
jgi:hypothetical protein